MHTAIKKNVSNKDVLWVQNQVSLLHWMISGTMAYCFPNFSLSLWILKLIYIISICRCSDVLVFVNCQKSCIGVSWGGQFEAASYRCASYHFIPNESLQHRCYVTIVKLTSWGNPCIYTTGCLLLNDQCLLFWRNGWRAVSCSKTPWGVQGKTCSCVCVCSRVFYVRGGNQMNGRQLDDWWRRTGVWSLELLGKRDLSLGAVTVTWWVIAGFCCDLHVEPLTAQSRSLKRRFYWK